MGRLAARGFATILKLAAGLAVLALGWVVFAPERTRGWAWTAHAEPWIGRAISALPLERPAWGVLLLAFGGACVLAAPPKRAAAPSRPRAGKAINAVEAPALAEGAGDHDPGLTMIVGDRVPLDVAPE